MLPRPGPPGNLRKGLERGQAGGGSATDPGNQIQIDLTALRYNAFEPATPYSTPDEIILNIVHAAYEKLAGWEAGRGSRSVVRVTFNICPFPGSRCFN